MSTRHWTLRTKLQLGFGVLTLLLAGVAAGAIFALAQAQAGFADFIAGASTRAALANELRNHAAERAIAVRNIVLVEAPSEKASERAAAEAAHLHTGEALSALRERLALAADASAREREAFAALESVERRYGEAAKAILGLASDGHKEEAVQRMNQDCRPLLAQLMAGAHVYLETVQEQAQARVAEDAARYAGHRRLLIGAAVLAIAVSLVSMLWITRDLMRALGAEPEALNAVARRVAAGDLSRVDGAAQAPPSSVLASLGEMQDGLTRMVSQVRQAAQTIATGSVQIAGGNADLSRRTEVQASSLQQTSASMHELTGAVRQNADTAREATTLATQASECATRGGEVVGQVVATMDAISGSSRQIAEIIGTIDGIAFQTNILALNAAVEAARAGEQGRGFAVVAAEVRTLAQRSADAAKQIKTLIGASVEKVEAGARQVGDAGRAVGDIVDQVRRVAGLISEIGQTSAEQTTGIGEVAQAVAQLDQVTQQNASLVQESAAAADALKLQAGRLAELVAAFRIDDRALARAEVAAA